MASYGSSSQSSHLPAIWNDDGAMQGFMAMIKKRSVNAVDHDRKVKFWADAIQLSCAGECNAIFNLDILRRRFKRGDLIPPSLPIVLETMKSNGDIVSLSDWKDNHSNSWIGWGKAQISKTSGWLFGGSSTDTIAIGQLEKFVHIPTVEKQAGEILELYRREFKDDIDSTREVVAYDEFYDKAKGIFFTKENFDIILEHMSQKGDVVVGQGRNGDKILKFKDNDRSNGSPVRFTEADASVHDIRKAMTRLDNDINNLERKVKKLDNECRAALRVGEKMKAANLLRQKKLAEKDLADKDAQYQRLLTMLQQIGATKHNKDVLEAYKAGTQAFKANLARHGLSPEKIDETMDDVASALDDYKDIEEAIGQGLGRANREDEDELEKELESLMTKKDDSLRLPSLPQVPSNTLGFRDEDDITEVEQDSLEKRWARLKQNS